MPPRPSSRLIPLSFWAALGFNSHMRYSGYLANKRIAQSFLVSQSRSAMGRTLSHSSQRGQSESTAKTDAIRFWGTLLHCAQVSPVSCPHIPEVSNNLPHSYIYTHTVFRILSTFGYIISCHHLPMMHEGPVGYCLCLITDQGPERSSHPPATTQWWMKLGPSCASGLLDLQTHWVSPCIGLGVMWVVKPKRLLCRLRF